MIYLKDQPSLINKQSLDMRFVFKTKRGGYSFINPVVQNVFSELYLTIDAIERFVRYKHNDYTGSFLGSLFELYLKRKLLQESQKTLRLDQHLTIKFQDVYQNGMRYLKTGGLGVDFRERP